MIWLSICRSGRGDRLLASVRAVQVAEGVFEVADQLREGESWAFAPILGRGVGSTYSPQESKAW